jgi:TRAP-type uncharacterized transport system substrate-binding protein
MIAEKMAMTITGTSHSAMVLTPADRLQRRHDYMEKARACRAIIEKLCPPALADLPFHPGAVRFYREIGIKIPDALVPTN